MPAVREVFGEDPGEPPVREVTEIHHYLAPRPRTPRDLLAGGDPVSLWWLA